MLGGCEAALPVLHGAAGPKRATFTVQISSVGVKQITFYLDGRKLKKLKQSQAKGDRFAIRVNPRGLSYGAHRVKIKALMSDPVCAPVARSSVFVRPHSQRAVPKFTG